jgi:hypothetical protein
VRRTAAAFFSIEESSRIDLAASVISGRDAREAPCTFRSRCDEVRSSTVVFGRAFLNRELGGNGMGTRVSLWKPRRVTIAAQFTLALTLVASCASRDDDEIDRAKCEQLRDHLIDLRLQDAQHLPTITTPPAVPVARNYQQAGPLGYAMPAATPPTAVLNAPIDFAQHRKAMKQAMGEGFIGGCTTKMSVAEVRCLLDAKDSAAANSCPKGSSGGASPPQTASK